MSLGIFLVSRLCENICCKRNEQGEGQAIRNALSFTETGFHLPLSLSLITPKFLGTWGGRIK